MILSFGSLNIDHVYNVKEISVPGETIAAIQYQVFSGGKGLNQAIAAARAGGRVHQAGCVGPEGVWLRDLMAAEKVDVSLIDVLEVPTGHAIIQVSEAGENSIIIFGGANQAMAPLTLEQGILSRHRPDFLLLQNETNLVPDAIKLGARQGIPVAFNPVPMDDRVMHEYPMQDVSLLFVNEIEGALLAGEDQPDAIMDAILGRFPALALILTLGPAGAIYGKGDTRIRVTGQSVEVVDTTAAGDTFVGFFLAWLDQGHPPDQALALANQAAALCVTRPGASPSIPFLSEIERLGGEPAG